MQTKVCIMSVFETKDFRLWGHGFVSLDRRLMMPHMEISVLYLTYFKVDVTSYDHAHN